MSITRGRYKGCNSSLKVGIGVAVMAFASKFFVFESSDTLGAASGDSKSQDRRRAVITF